MAENRTIPRQPVFEARTGWALAALLAASSAGADTLHPTAAGRYRVGWSCQPAPPARAHAQVCVAHVEDAAGRPVAGLDIALAVRPPTPGHGTPSHPQVAAYLGRGDYRVAGLGPSSGGRWVLGFRIGRGTEADSVAFEVELP